MKAEFCHNMSLNSKQCFLIALYSWFICESLKFFKFSIMNLSKTKGWCIFKHWRHSLLFTIVVMAKLFLTSTIDWGISRFLPIFVLWRYTVFSFAKYGQFICSEWGDMLILGGRFCFIQKLVVVFVFDSMKREILQVGYFKICSRHSFWAFTLFNMSKPISPSCLGLKSKAWNLK